jgi:formate dehydrogenase major subunit
MEAGVMVNPVGGLNRREFFQASASGGFAFGSLFGLGLDLQQAKAEVSKSRFASVREVPSVCPYCAVGCGQIVSVGTGADGKDRIVNIEGNVDSPISRGTLCPKGAATYQLAVNDFRATQVWYRAPGAADWDKTRTLGWAMDRIAQLVKQTRDATFQHTWTTKDKDGGEVKKRVNHTLAIASLGGATMDNEWNYVHTKLLRSLGVVSIENQARI